MVARHRADIVHFHFQHFGVHPYRAVERDCFRFRDIRIAGRTADTVYAWVVAIVSLPLMLVFAKTENRRLMLSIVALFVFSHILSGVAANYNMLMISRMGVACSHAIFWSIVTPLAVRVAPEGKAFGIQSGNGSPTVCPLGICHQQL